MLLVGFAFVFFSATPVMGQSLKFIYLTDGGTGGPPIGLPPSPGFVKRINADGTGLTTLVPGLTRPRGIAVDPVNGHIYWNDWGTSSTQRSDLDGSNVTTILNHPY